ncbi:MAG: hypothetical protein UD035_03710 [Coprococcus comes]|jgi:hypothetical protein|nr:hypothetical protein [Coprococcus comes]
MGKGTIKTKAMTMAVAMSMVAGLCPSTVFAASGSVVAKDGTYTATKYSLQGTTQGRYLTGGVPPVRFSM